ncbi:helix-turn-helix domain-containing protein [Streptomyces sp. NPDC047990]|uniref:helix-turn-helix domain-containing protein n=1 Tax=Streptomyces sp. NPDC047990 TaxID=3365496 RepID=UPI0037114F7B
MTTDGDPAPTRAQKFGEYVSTAARAAGYDIDSPRGGGKKALADRAGMSHASVSRMLAGQTIPDPKFFESLADALKLEVGRMLVEAGVLSERSLSYEEPRPPQEINPREMARTLGITAPDKIEAFVAMAKALAEPDEHHATRRSA